MNASDDSVDVCLLTGTTAFPEWFVDAIQTMLNESSAQLKLVALKSKTGNSVDGEDLRRVTRLPLVAATGPLKRNPQHTHSLDDFAWFSDQLLLECKPVEVDSYRLAIPSETVEEIVQNCDIVIHFGFGILSGEILSRPKYGVLSFHHGDVRKYRGAPAGFWEFINEESEIGVTLQQLTETLDGGKVVAIQTIDITDAPFLAEVRKRVTEASTGMLAEAIRQIETSNFKTDPLTEDELGDLYKKSDIQRAERAKYALITIKKSLRRPLSSVQIYVRNLRFLIENRGP